MAFVLASYVLRRYMRYKQMVDALSKNTLGLVAHLSFFLASTTAIVGAPSTLYAASSRHGWDCTTAHTTSAASIPHQPERRLEEDIAFRVLAADNHPNFRTIYPDFTARSI